MSLVHRTNMLCISIQPYFYPFCGVVITAAGMFWNICVSFAHLDLSTPVIRAIIAQTLYNNFATEFE